MPAWTDHPRGPDGRDLKILLVGDPAWAVSARDLGMQVVYLGQAAEPAAVAVALWQEGCHGLIADLDVETDLPTWHTSAIPKEVLEFFSQPS